MNLKYYPLLLLFVFCLLLTVHFPVHAQTPPKAVTTPNFNTLAPCPTCATPSYPVISGGASPATSATQPNPGASMAPCQTDSATYQDNRRKSKHKKHRGAISKSMDKLIEFIIKLLNMLLKLLGGGQINMPSSGEPVPSVALPEALPSSAEAPVISSMVGYPNTDPQPSPQANPCPPTSQPAGGQTTQPSGAMSVPSGGVMPSGGAQQPIPSGATAASGKQGCGGAPAPAASEPLPANGSITTGGTAGSPKVYDGACKQVGTITIKADYVTVQNFMVVATGQYGIQSEGTGITIQNNDIKGVKKSGDGDLNAITFFGNDTKILNNTAIDFVAGDPGGSHTDAIQTWISSSHPTGSTNVIIQGNKFSGPQNPSRNNAIPSIHQCIMAEGPGKGGNSGGSGSSSNWLIADNYFLDSWNQCIKVDGINNVIVTRNEFAGSSDKIMDVPSSTVKYFSDNKMTGQYKNGVGTTVTQGAGPTSLTGGTAPATP